MKNDREMAAYAKPQLGQHFLVCADKLSKLVAAAGIRPTDDVLEVGAASAPWREHFLNPEALQLSNLMNGSSDFSARTHRTRKVLHGDALEIIQSFSFDVLIGNLPHKVTESLIRIMPGLSFRTAILSVGESTDLSPLDRAFSWSEVTRTTGDDFLPPQPSVSRIVQVIPLTGGAASTR